MDLFILPEKLVAKIIFACDSSQFIYSNGWVTWKYESLGIQCDQIWRNFTTLPKVYKSLANFWKFIFQNAEPSIDNVQFGVCQARIG